MYLSIYSRCLMYVLHSSAILIDTSFLFFVATIQTLRYRHLKVISLVSELYRPRFYLKVAILSDFFLAVHLRSQGLFSSDQSAITPINPPV